MLDLEDPNSVGELQHSARVLKVHCPEIYVHIYILDILYHIIYIYLVDVFERNHALKRQVHVSSLCCVSFWHKPGSLLYIYSITRICRCANVNVDGIYIWT